MEKATLSHSIVLVDDDAAIRDLYSSALIEAGYSVTTAKDGEDGLNKIKSKHPDLIILDLMMPKMDGREVLKTLKSDPTLNKIPVVILSALITELEKHDSMASGALDYIEKSDIESPDQLVTKVKSVLGN